MNNKILVVICSFLFFSSVSTAQKAGAIPKNAKILETQAVGHNRKMVLWMLNPTMHPSKTNESDFYTCPDQTRGSYYTGELRVTLINTLKNRSINTLKIVGPEGEVEIDVPYAIRGGYFYFVPNTSKTRERKPRIMTVRDYNGDARAEEFALFNAEACQGLGTTLIGYSEKQDRVIQYYLEINTAEGTATSYWGDYLFYKKPIRPGFWRYEIDYRGRNGTLDKYVVRYDKRSEKFYGTLSNQR